jgi:N-acetylneuraminate synthase
MDPVTWRDMVDRARELESALGSTLKRVEENERETVIVQRRAVRTRTALPAGHVLTRDDIVVLRPATPGAVSAAHVAAAVGKALTRDLEADDAVMWTDLAGS